MQSYPTLSKEQYSGPFLIEQTYITCFLPDNASNFSATTVLWFWRVIFYLSVMWSKDIKNKMWSDQKTRFWELSDPGLIQTLVASRTDHFSVNVLSFFSVLRQRQQCWSHCCRRVLHQVSSVLSGMTLYLWLLLLILIGKVVIFCTSAGFQETIALLSKDEPAVAVPTVLLFLGLLH